MDPVEKQMVEEIYDLVKKNNEILRSMRRSMILGRVFRTIYWIVIIGLAIGAFYYFQPYVEQFTKILQSFKENAEGIGKLFDSVKGQ